MICTAPVCDHYACGLRAKGIQVAPSATPSRSGNRPHRLRPMQEGSWEKGIAGEHRRDGSFMPYLRPGTTEPMSVKDLADRRSHVETAVARLKSDPNIFKEQ